jgi:hypothetical protein
MNRGIATADEQFDVEQETISSKSMANMVAWKLDADWMNLKLDPAKKRWVAAWAAYKPKETRTPLVTFEKNRSREDYEPLLSKLIGMLRFSAIVTDDDLKAMGIYIDPKHPSRNPAPDTKVEFEIDSSMIRRLIVRYRDAGSDSYAKPHGVHGVEIRWAILSTPPVKVDDLINSSFDTHTPFTLEFDEDQRGQTVYFCLRWEGTAGLKGPWSEIVHAIIP